MCEETTNPPRPDGSEPLSVPPVTMEPSIDEGEAETAAASSTSEEVESSEPSLVDPPPASVDESDAEPPFGIEDLRRELGELEQRVEGMSRKLLQSFEDKLAFDQHKEKQIDTLHAELQEYKRDLLAKTTRPLVNGLIRLHGHLARMGEDLQGMPSEELTLERFCEILDGFRDDVEMVLEDNGIQLFQEPEERFEPRRQSSRRTLEAPKDELVGCVAERVRPGYQQGELLIQKERVDVYVRNPSASESA